MRSVLISTYEMGRQPFGIASAAAWMGAAGWDVTCLDVAKEPLHEGRLVSADLIGFHLPMHTATRLAGADHRRRAAGEPGGAHLRVRALRAVER